MTGARTIASALGAATRALRHSTSARLDAELLLASVLDAPRTRLFSEPERLLSRAEDDAFERLVAARRHSVPIPYLTGRAEFWSLSLEINDQVLVPRSDTELLVEAALEVLGMSTATRAIDLGTGSGAVALAMARERPCAQVFALDRSIAALTLARRNAERLEIENVAFFASDWLSACAAADFDLIVSNPPYIDPAESALLDRELAHEPAASLFAGDAGLADLRRIIDSAGNYLRPGGHLIVEHGFRQGEQVRALCRERGYHTIETLRDLGERERVTRAGYGHGDEAN